MNSKTRKQRNKKISISFSNEDLENLQNGETFDWTFDGVDVHLYQGYDDNDGNDCTKCGNPLKMYYCYNCESNQEESGECFMCGHSQGIKYVVVLDEDYHNDCN